ncbi:MAG: hypothetical protein RI911_635 [Candidatus Parcubacteria bacterium]|jgi:hypothetical protein
MMRYRHKRSASVRFVVTACLCAVLCSVFFFVDAFLGYPVQKYVQMIASRALLPVHTMTTGKLAAYFVSKEELQSENRSLKAEIERLKSTSMVALETTQSLASLCALIPDDATLGELQISNSSLPRSNSLSRVAGYDNMIFGTLLVSFTDARRPMLGDFAFDDAGYVLGVVASLTDTGATISLMTREKNQIEVRIGHHTTKVEGKLNNTFLGKIPQEIDVSEGDIVMHLETMSPLGEIVRIERSPADAEVLIYMRPFAETTTEYVYTVPKINAKHE